jgi:hypothetical protein
MPPNATATSTGTASSSSSRERTRQSRSERCRLLIGGRGPPPADWPSGLWSPCRRRPPEALRSGDPPPPSPAPSTGSRLVATPGRIALKVNQAALLRPRPKASWLFIAEAAGRYRGRGLPGLTWRVPLLAGIARKVLHNSFPCVYANSEQSIALAQAVTQEWLMLQQRMKWAICTRTTACTQGTGEVTCGLRQLENAPSVPCAGRASP